MVVTLTPENAAETLTPKNLFFDNPQTAPDAPEPTPDGEPTKQPPLAADNADDLLQEHRDYNCRLAKQREEIRRCEDRVKFCKDELKSAKGELDSAHSAIDREIDDFNIEMPLFDGIKDEQPAEPVKPASEDDESWRTIPLGYTPIPDALVRKLADADIVTIGNLTDWTSADKPLTDIPGIGESKAEKIREAMDKFWKGRKGD